MAKVNYILKKGEVTLSEMINLQIILYCYMNKIIISSSDLECLTILAINGKSNLTDFCHQIADLEIFSSSQSVRNSLNKSENKKLIIKKGKSKKTIYVNPDMKIQAQGNIFMNIKFLRKEPQQKKIEKKINEIINKEIHILKTNET